ncbi:hypothetical protein EVAR_83412_1 [Eumeta japonica]|uniref:Uncharacterized protein n=1 Tax=Eumeta variegata TaxID=151549 RepID=A0A4C1TYG7_EUMVA|nr:hypothetical protein EVAR_83412_1 [Eumeta japonica]
MHLAYTAGAVRAVSRICVRPPPASAPFCVFYLGNDMGGERVRQLMTYGLKRYRTQFVRRAVTLHITIFHNQLIHSDGGVVESVASNPKVTGFIFMPRKAHNKAHFVDGVIFILITTAPDSQCASVEGLIQAPNEMKSKIGLFHK